MIFNVDISRIGFLAALCMGAFAWVVIQRTQPIVVIDGHISPHEIRRGESFRVHRLIEWRRHDCGGTDRLTVELIDEMGTSYKYAETSGGIREGTGILDLVGRDRMVPDTFSYGVGTYKARLIFSCFPLYSLWGIHMEVPPLTFLVLP